MIESVHIRPSSIMEIVQLYDRRDANVEYIIGTLYGKYTQGRILVVDAFVVPYRIHNNGSIRINGEWARHHGTQYQQAQPRYSIVGWFSTKTSFDHTDKSIHEFYSGLLKNPMVAVKIDFSLRNSHIEILPYKGIDYGIPLSLKNKEVQDISAGMAFVPLAPIEYTMPDEEKHFISVLAKSSSVSEPILIEDNYKYINRTLKQTDNHISAIATYLENVKKGKMKHDPDIGRMIHELAASIPKYSEDELNVIMEDEKADLMLGSYITQLLQIYLPMHDELLNASIRHASKD
ncbi:hypothetical protein ACOME3_001808 [Neoechinorhynchus agilis]